MNPKICFFSLAAYSYLAQKDTSSAGGAELQQALLAKELVKRGFDVSFIVDDFGQDPVEIVNGIKILKCSLRSPGSPKSSILKFYLIWKVLEKAGADVYYQRAANPVTGLISLFCILKRKKFVYSIAHKADVDGTYIIESYLKNLPPFMGSIYRQIFRFGVKFADCIIAQNEEQQELLKMTFKRESILIKSMHILPEERPKKDVPPIVLWVSSIQDFKRPGLFLKIARAIPSGRFQMIGGAFGDIKFYETIEAEAGEIPNLEFIGFVPHHRVNQYFERASIFVITSTAEGFPNTILQAWARYTPVVSLNVDPDEIICKYKLGLHSRTLERMAEDVKLLLEDGALREEMGKNGREYVEKEHNINKIMDEYIKVFEAL